MKSDRMPPMHFVDWIQRHAVARPSVPAIVTPRARLTYSEFHRASISAVHRLNAYGIERGQKIVVSAQSHALLAVLLCAFNRLGVAPLVRNVPTRPDERINVPSDFRVDKYVIEEPFNGVIPEGAVRVDLDWLKTTEEETASLGVQGFRAGDEITALFTTSGTTGAVKVFGLSCRQLEARLLKTIGILGEGRSESTFSHFGLGTAPGFRIAFETFWAGGSLYLGWPTRSVPDVIARNHIVRMYASPAQYQAILKMSDPSKFDLSRLRYAMVAGSTMSRPLIATVRTKLCERLVNLYGSTELGLMAFGHVTAQDPPGRLGVLVPWIDAQVVNADGDVLPAGEEGILRLRCAEMVSGYLNDARASAEHFKDGWFYPGDTGCISAERALTLTGRVSERINAGGVKVSPQVIEEAAVSFEGIAECAAFAAPDAIGMEQIWLAVVAQQEIDIEKLRKHCTEKLGARVPLHVLTVAELPRNETGKVLRSELVEIAAAQARRRTQ
jgi:acyl-coenzyme A synthetase/AMP-(fatty) acid ligase